MLIAKTWPKITQIDIQWSWGQWFELMRFISLSLLGKKIVLSKTLPQPSVVPMAETFAKKNWSAGITNSGGKNKKNMQMNLRKCSGKKYENIYIKGGLTKKLINYPMFYDAKWSSIQSKWKLECKIKYCICIFVCTLTSSKIRKSQGGKQSTPKKYPATFDLKHPVAWNHSWNSGDNLKFSNQTIPAKNLYAKKKSR